MEQLDVSRNLGKFEKAMRKNIEQSKFLGMDGFIWYYYNCYFIILQCVLHVACCHSIITIRIYGVLSSSKGLEALAAATLPLSHGAKGASAGAGGVGSGC